MGKSIGIIETYGMVAAYEGLDAALKSASVTLVSKELATGGIVTMIFEGEVGSVKAAVCAGVESVKKLNRPVTGHVIARLAEGMENIIGKSFSEKKERHVKSPPKSKQENEQINQIIENEDTSGEKSVDVEAVQESEKFVKFNGKTYGVFKKGGLDELKVVQLRQLARQLRVNCLNRSKIKFANKTELISAIRKHMRGGELD